MKLWQLLFDDEGRIARRHWWLGMGLLTLGYGLMGWLTARHLGRTGLDRPFMILASLIVLIPTYSVNAKRFRAIGRAPELALVGMVVGGAATLSAHFLKLPRFDLTLGAALLLVIIWYAIDLGIIDHSQPVDRRPRRA
jgi:uncharacterized membrane protein YhaH (DUF805 family)